MMPDAGRLAPTKRTSKPQQIVDDYKSTQETKHGEEREAKDDPEATFSHYAETKLDQPHQGERRCRMLRSLPDNTQRKSTSPREMPAFSSLPSPSADAGKLAPLDIGQHSPRAKSNHSSSLRSSSPAGNNAGSRPKEQRDSSPGITLALPTSGSGGYSSPRNNSPRLPAMKTPPSPRNEEALPELSPRNGGSSPRRVRSLSPKRWSCTEPIEPIHPDDRGTAGAGRLSPLPDATLGDPSRGSSITARDMTGRLRDGTEGLSNANGAFDNRRRRSREPAEAKLEPSHHLLSGSKFCSPPRVRRNDRRFSAEDAQGSPQSATRSSIDSERFNRASPPVDSVENDALPTPVSPSGRRGSVSPRTRRMRPQHDGTN